MSHAGKDVTWNRLFRSDPNFAKDGKGRTIIGDYDRGWYAALDAAREAVASAGVRKDTSYDMRMQALAAIDALREGRE